MVDGGDDEGEDDHAEDGAVEQLGGVDRDDASLTTGGHDAGKLRRAVRNLRAHNPTVDE